MAALLLPPAPALGQIVQQAQFRLLRGSDTEACTRYIHPFYWAPLVIMGNWL
jgi:CHAT domain-containing protein